MATGDKKRNAGEQALKDSMAEARQRQRQAIRSPATAQSASGIGQNMGAAATMPVYGQQTQQPAPAIFGTGVQRQIADSFKETPIVGVGTGGQEQSTSTLSMPVGREQAHKYNKLLTRYKAGKASVERRVQDAERWWKMRNDFMVAMHTDGERSKDNHREPLDGFKAETGWLHNVIVSKHADALEAYPSPNILPREASDKATAWALSKVIPVVLKQIGFEATYDECIWQKLKTGTAIYKVVWDAEKLNGLGDISITRVDLLNIFWEPGVRNIQDSRYVFHTAYVYEDDLRSQYPELEGKPLASAIVPAKNPNDDNVDTQGKVVVVDCYYKRQGKLHYCKYVGDTVLYATENDPIRADKGLYDHGKYPFVFDTLFPIENSPAGYGYVDICANPQTRIDLLQTAFLRNAMVGSIPRYFLRSDGSINEEEFLDLNSPVVHVTGNLGEDSIRAMQYNPLHGNYANLEQTVINELRETSGNTETSTGSSTNGVTAASALAALQEASGKGSRASTKATYRAYSDIIYMVIELIRQFYDQPRIFRITGTGGQERFIPFTNSAMLPVHQGVVGDLDLGYRTPVYDIEVSPEKQSTYTRLSQNELAMQLYSLGLFNPQMADQALVCLNMMDFDGKDELIQRINMNSTMLQQLQLYKAMAATLAAKYEPTMVGGLMAGGQQPMPEKKSEAPKSKQNQEASHVTRARQQSAEATQPE